MVSVPVPPHEGRREADVVLVSRVRPLRLQGRKERSASTVGLGITLFCGTSGDSNVGIRFGRPREECLQRLQSEPSARPARKSDENDRCDDEPAREVTSRPS